MRKTILSGFLFLQASLGFGQAIWAPETELPSPDLLPQPYFSFTEILQAGPRLGKAWFPTLPASHISPMTSPLPFNTKLPVLSLERHRSPSAGIMTVTPVRTGPLPATRRPLPDQTVVWSTLMPLTSVMALYLPGRKRPVFIPRSCARAAVLSFFPVKIF